MFDRAVDAVSIEYSLERGLYEKALAETLIESGDNKAAIQVYRQTLSARREFFPPQHTDIAMALEALGQELLRQSQFLEAKTAFRECMTIRESTLGPQHWRTAAAQSLLGEAIYRQTSGSVGCTLILNSFDILQLHHNFPRHITKEARARIALCP